MRTLFREANKPEPLEKVNKDGTITWGEHNLYPQFLNSLYEDNPIHGGIVNQKVKFITAGGITIEGDNGVLANGAGAYSLEEVMDLACLDYEISESFAVLWKRSKMSNSWYAVPMDYELIRKTENGVFYEYSEDWSKKKQDPEKTGYYKIKSIRYVTAEDDKCIQLYQAKTKQRILGDLSDRKKTLNCNYYTAPVYSGAITSIMAGIEMDFFTYSEVVNGWKGGTLINLANGVPESPQEEDKIIKRVKNEATNRKTQGGLSVTFSDGKDRAPEVHQISGNDLDKRYIESGKEILRKIMIAHGVISPALFGVLSETLFGSKEEMEVAYKLFQENYVKTRQDTLAGAFTWALKRLNGFTGKITYNEFIPSILKTVEVVEEPAPVEEQMTAEDKVEDLILDLFSKCGRAKDGVELFSSRSYTGSTDEEFKEEFLKGKFAEDLTKDQKVIINMIKSGESYPAISKAIGKGGNYLSNQLVELGNMGLLDGWEVTLEGEASAIDEIDLEVLYSYELKPSAPDLVKGGKSRDFCRALISLDRLYTRAEIDQISGQVNRDVWTYRGGWYHNPDTGVNTPSCRHEWRQHITIK